MTVAMPGAVRPHAGRAMGGSTHRVYNTRAVRVSGRTMAPGVEHLRVRETRLEAVGGSSAGSKVSTSVSGNAWRSKALQRAQVVVHSTDSGSTSPLMNNIIVKQVRKMAKPLDGLWGRLVPMSLMFYFMAFANSIMDAVKDTLVVTAFGGAEQIPYLTVYAVLPMSLLFVSLFARLSSKLGREKLFYLAVSVFMVFFALFTGVLYPNREFLHPTATAAAMATMLPRGLAGGIAVFTNWTYSLFYVAGELWGDVVLSLLFWGLANEITRVSEAGIIYPLLGIGANVAQACSGVFMKFVTTQWHPAGVSAENLWAAKLRLFMTVVMLCGFAIMAIHKFICDDAKKDATSPMNEKLREHERLVEANAKLDPKDQKKKKKAGLLSSLAYVFESPEVACLAVMAVAQGLSSIIFQVAWKTQLRILRPDPTSYAAYMGDVQTYSGMVTGIFMIAAPFLFKNLGWKGTLSVTPKTVIFLGWIFFGTSIYALRHGALSQDSSLLSLLVLGGAVIYIVERAAKFSLFKPAEEMVYITLDEDSRTKGKAAVDVLGSQIGKTGGSFMQQGLIFVYGSIIGALPVLVCCHSAIALCWLVSVNTLAARRAAQLDSEIREGVAEHELNLP
eukprot:CAMPEP_0179724786 /NCGR_PEP_ID=MMETSP0938-20121108/6200_1 /TAXON_ID=548131 ORGANISM="Ostreococcus mediterraneus, Strain clade-D-RCC1107" /NCGR_SAMPLE_ID=MMETSP0938 /ASSEMBLY_ACC=CAM_ASM_000576 /LENGTH=615 /DNA_ID=CAMNT_0021598823 /DNA_START=120 /DNA_END=1964 /DNA_ORIENTATION=+